MFAEKKEEFKIENADKKLPIHLVGIGGAGMSAIAIVLAQMGFIVEGSDLKESAYVRRLREFGIKVAIGHRVENLSCPQLVVVSSAISPDNPEVTGARELEIPVVTRAEMLQQIMSTKKGIAVAGTHGKTTTASLITWMMMECKTDPSFLIGGELNEIGSNANYSDGEYLVAEADESDGSLLSLRPFVAVLTNVDGDHLDYFGSLDRTEAIFSEFLSLLPEDGFALVCGEDPRAVKATQDYVRKGGNVFMFGEGFENDYRFDEVEMANDHWLFDIYFRDEKLGEARMKLSGLHNAYNALATFAVGHQLGLPVEGILRGIEKFSGVRRRFEAVGEFNGITVFDDYAHHPTEIGAVIGTARAIYPNRLVVVFQPHRYSRTKLLANAFGTCFDGVDLLFVTDIYGAGEEPEPGITGKIIVDSVKKYNPGLPVIYIRDRKTLAKEVCERLKPQDMVITMGAGDITHCAREIIEINKKK
ncbi:MAG: UDP-N-acetylmuramate--L-alanine ligase [Actinomycetota bacterium]|nr:UDP-N-acetylmuramate--L-alanine ligase [Actinomycetota bacterium]